MEAALDPNGRIFPRSSLRGALAIFAGFIAAILVAVAGAPLAIQIVAGVVVAILALGLSTAWGPYKRDRT